MRTTSFFAKTLFLAGSLLVAVPAFAGAINVEFFSVAPFSGPSGTIFTYSIKIQGTESYVLSLTCPPGVTAGSGGGDICKTPVEYPRSNTTGYFILNSSVPGYQIVYAKARLIDKTTGQVYDEGSANVGVTGPTTPSSASATSSSSVTVTESTTTTTPPAPSTPSNQGQATAQAACVRLNNNMRYGSTNSYTGNEVSLLQAFLHEKGYLSVEPTGFFGRLTLQAVINFQKNNLVPGTGFAGPLTRAAITRLTCGS